MYKVKYLFIILKYNYFLCSLDILFYFFQLTKKRCAREYNVNCLKVDFISSIEKLGKSTDFQILPGIRVISNADTFALQKADDSKMVFSANNVGEQLDDILVRRLVSYARSLSLNVQLFDKDQRKGKSFGFNLIPNLFTSVEGRGKIIILC